LVAKAAFEGVERGAVIVVIDVLRCSSTIVASLANGASSVIPAETVKEARKFRESHPGSILAGERGGLKPKGFDQGNSPLEFTSKTVAGKSIILTTTSGTKALIRSKKAEWVLVGALLNAKRVAEKSLDIAQKEKGGISLTLAGTKGGFSLEDFICAGAIIENLGDEEVRLSDAASAASLSFRGARDRLYENILKGQHAQNLVRLGFEDDVEFCCRLDYSSVVPIYRNGVITSLS